MKTDQNKDDKKGKILYILNIIGNIYWALTIIKHDNQRERLLECRKIEHSHDLTLSEKIT